AAAGAGRELWRFVPATGQIARVSPGGRDGAASTMAISPDGRRLAYVTAASAPARTNAGWTLTSGTGPATPVANAPESVWVSALGDGTAPGRIFELQSVATSTSASIHQEHIADLVWTPDGTRLVAITRQDGPPPRARIFLLSVATDDNSAPPESDE